MNRKKDTYKLKFGILIALLAVAFPVSLMLGRYSIDIREIGTIILGNFTGSAGEIPEAAVKVFLEIRFPRVIVAMLVGASLAVSGATYQGMFRNPIASPDILGASTGAGFGAALGILLGFRYLGISLFSFMLGIGAVVLAYLISRASKGEPILSMILAGMIVSGVFSAGTSFVKLVADTDDQLPAITYWLMGSLSDVQTADLLRLLIPVVIGMVPLFLLRWRINLLTIGEDEARSMGVNTTVLRVIAVLCATLLTAASVAVAGMIGWVGLVIPHFCRILFGYDYRRLIPATALLGASFLLIVDDVARLATTSEIPLGILTSLIGAPVFLYLFLRRRDYRVS